MVRLFLQQFKLSRLACIFVLFCANQHKVERPISVGQSFDLYENMEREKEILTAPWEMCMRDLAGFFSNLVVGWWWLLFGGDGGRIRDF